MFSSVPGKIIGMEYEIEVKDGTKPITSQPYKVPFHLKTMVKEELDKWLELGIIRESNSQWTSPMVVVRNSDGTIRLTIDYRKINPHVRTDNYPMPTREVVIEKLHNSKFLSKLDLTKAYLQIPLSEESKKYSSFVVENGQFEFNVVPFGIRFVSGLCNRLIKGVVKGCESFITTFVDDLVVFSDSYEEALGTPRYYSR